MWADTFLRLTRSARFRRILWKPIYELVSRIVDDTDFRFMNYGYVPFPDEQPIVLEPGDEQDRYPIQLYHYLAIRAEVAGKNVLEVGCGRGGGASYIYRYLKPETMTGLDLAQRAVRFATENLKGERLRYIQGNAEHIPISNDSFDTVINVESSHAYGSFPTFLAEVKRVLRPGGIFMITDMRLPEDMKIMIKDLNRSGMEILEETDITQNVVDAMDQEEDLKQLRIKRMIPKWMQEQAREFWGVRGSVIHRHLRDRKRIYYRWKLRKGLGIASPLYS